MSNASNAQVLAYTVAAKRALSSALNKGFSFTTNPSTDVSISLPDPITGLQKQQAITVSTTQPTGVKGKVWLDVGPGTAGYNQFFVFQSGWVVIPPGALIYNPVSVVGVTASNVSTNQTMTQTTATGTLNLAATDVRVQQFSTTLTGNVTVNLPSTSLVDGLEFQIVRNATTAGAFTFTVADSVSGRSYTIASGARGFVQWRCTGTAGWLILAAGSLP